MRLLFYLSHSFFLYISSSLPLYSDEGAWRLTDFLNKPSTPYNCPKGNTCLLFSQSCSFLFFFRTRCVSPLDLPRAGPHDSFSTDILKQSKTLPSPMPFPPHFPFSLSLSSDSHCWIVSACSARQEQRNQKSNREGMRLIWNLYSWRFAACLPISGSQRGSCDKFAQVLLWVLLGGSLQEVNTPPVWGGG